MVCDIITALHRFLSVEIPTGISHYGINTCKVVPVQSQGDVGRGVDMFSDADNTFALYGSMKLLVMRRGGKTFIFRVGVFGGD